MELHDAGAPNIASGASQTTGKLHYWHVGTMLCCKPPTVDDCFPATGMADGGDKPRCRKVAKRQALGSLRSGKQLVERKAIERAVAVQEVAAIKLRLNKPQLGWRLSMPFVKGR